MRLFYIIRTVQILIGLTIIYIMLTTTLLCGYSDFDKFFSNSSASCHSILLAKYFYPTRTKNYIHRSRTLQTAIPVTQKVIPTTNEYYISRKKTHQVNKEMTITLDTAIKSVQHWDTTAASKPANNESVHNAVSFALPSELTDFNESTPALQEDEPDLLQNTTSIPSPESLRIRATSSFTTTSESAYKSPKKLSTSPAYQTRSVLVSGYTKPGTKASASINDHNLRRLQGNGTAVTTSEPPRNQNSWSSYKASAGFSTNQTSFTTSSDSLHRNSSFINNETSRQKFPPLPSRRRDITSSKSMKVTRPIQKTEVRGTTSSSKNRENASEEKDQNTVYQVFFLHSAFRFCDSAPSLQQISRVFS
ncbi:hypothetical protein AB6A40_009825 [Gnathostoma spinigerum]|uniref:Uncharacterized protein n=1 Tax=Gnathostoma spinigerum TaxID=75299 RepID=A0ABD6EUV6_9BILA